MNVLARDKIVKNKTNYLGSMFALYVQEYELRIIESIVEDIRENTKLARHGNKLNSLIYEFDGIKLECVNVNEYGGSDAVIKYLNNVLKSKGWNLKFEEKPIVSSIDLSPHMEAVLKKRERFGDNNDQSFKAVTERFEINAFKIEDSGCYGTSTSGKFQIVSRNDLLNKYEHMEYTKMDGSKANFIGKWIKTPDLRRYASANIYPPWR